jgi:hypothetical protein
MKARILGKVLLLTILFTCVSHAKRSDYGPGNGGGGILRKDRYMTFHSAGFFVEPPSLHLNDVPSLLDTIQYFKRSDLVPKIISSNLIKVLIPSGKRNYYKVSSNAEELKHLKKIYRDNLKIPGSDRVAIFAITNRNNGDTYLLPSFYRLNKIEQMTILYHEVLWLYHSKISYKQVIEKEINFQSHLENPLDASKAYRFIQDIVKNDERLVLKTGILLDIKHNFLKGLYNPEDGSIMVRSLIGEDYYRCISENLKNDYCNKAFMRTHLISLSLEYPQSIFLKYLSEQFIKGFERGSPLGIMVTYSNEDYIGDFSLNLMGYGLSSYRASFRGALSDEELEEIKVKATSILDGKIILNQDHLSNQYDSGQLYPVLDENGDVITFTNKDVKGPYFGWKDND